MTRTAGAESAGREPSGPYDAGMSEAAHEFPIDRLAAVGDEIRRAADHGDVVCLTDHGERIAVVLPYAPTARSEPGRRRLDEVIGTLPGFEHDVDVEAQRDGWDPR